MISCTDGSIVFAAEKFFQLGAMTSPAKLRDVRPENGTGGIGRVKDIAMGLSE